MFAGAWEESSCTKLDLAAAMLRLTDKQSAALRLCMAGYSQPEIGRLMGVEKAAVCRLLGRARQIVAAGL